MKGEMKERLRAPQSEVEVTRRYITKPVASRADKTERKEGNVETYRGARGVEKKASKDGEKHTRRGTAVRDKWEGMDGRDTKNYPW
ncbi:hypothetical protein KUCAC02_000660 [Chaenocephalus aceratus]|uniref:Uncharacterized protein n=1 Tax=Chaenocephalus aceratus TaxID=36190 RepID=A0ACB9W7G3_CHAAC|nr:hypothetical protein KUCAC02_000660 [Chaenocephalus aceratus]